MSDEFTMNEALRVAILAICTLGAVGGVWLAMTQHPIFCIITVVSMIIGFVAFIANIGHGGSNLIDA